MTILLPHRFYKFLAIIILCCAYATVSFSQMAGTYTIGGPSANFPSFSAAANALSNGVSGPVVLNVSPAIYNEQVSFPTVPGSSSINTIKIKGNLATLRFNSSDSVNRCGIILNGTDFLTIDSLQIDGENGTFAWGVLFTNSANNNVISNCVIRVSKSSVDNGRHIPIIINGSTSKFRTSGNNGNNNNIYSNDIAGGFEGISLHGNASINTQNSNNVIYRNNVKDVYATSIYSGFQFNTTIDSNNIWRPTRINSGNAIGICVESSTETTVSRNSIHSMFDGQTVSTSKFTGLSSFTNTYLSNNNQNVFSNNLIHNIKGNGDKLGIYSKEYGSPQYLHNTIIFDNKQATAGNCSLL